MSDRMTSPREKLKRAKKHIKELDAALTAFRDTDPYGLTRQLEPDTGYVALSAVVKVQPPIGLSLIAGDAIHNLRSALDLLVTQLILANNAPPDDHDSFPIYKSRKAFEANGVGVIKARISASAEKLIKSLKPYNGGNDALWIVHQLDIVDKHRTLMTAVGSYGQLLYLFDPAQWIDDPLREFPKVVLPINPADKLCPLKDGDVVFRCPAEDLERHAESKITFPVALNEPGIVECEPLFPTLVDLSGTIEETIELFVSLPEFA